MKAEYINPFVQASFSVLETVLGAAPVKGDLAAQPTIFTSQQCNVVCGVTGQVQGQVIYGMSLTTADRVASAMLGQTIKTFDALAASAIGELGNMISGNAMQHLSEAGWVCDITPPTLMRGSNVKISTISIPSIVIPLTVEQGQIFVTIGLQGRK
jgi:chemotaxis protein CheX